MKLKFLPQELVVEVGPDKSVLEVAHENNIAIRSLCAGLPSCAECRVKVVSGENNVLPPNRAEINLIGSSYFVDHRRLACQLRCFGDVVIDTTEQLVRADTQTKKIRGAKKGAGASESHALQDTLLLDADKPLDQSSKTKK